MYEKFYHMTHTPFSRKVPAEALYESKAMTDCLGRLAYVADRQLFAVVTASPMALVLVGQSELWEDKLRLKRYDAVRQRIDINCVLPHLDRAETEKYIQSHLTYAGIIDRELFSRRAMDEIFRLSCGIPRLINRICEKSLMYGCQQNLRIIDDQDVIYVSEHEMLRGGEQS